MKKVNIVPTPTTKKRFFLTNEELKENDEKFYSLYAAYLNTQEKIVKEELYKEMRAIEFKDGHREILDHIKHHILPETVINLCPKQIYDNYFANYIAAAFEHNFKAQNRIYRLVQADERVHQDDKNMLQSIHKGTMPWPKPEAIPYAEMTL